MEFLTTNFPNLVVIKPKVFSDNRGFFLESYSRKRFSDAGITVEFVQDNHSCSVSEGVLRGMHCQLPPYAQSKLIRVIKGSIFDVVIDLRKTSPTYGKWTGFELSSENFLMLFVPRGFAHGFCTLEPDTEVLYKVDNLYAPSYDAGIRWADPDIAIRWPVQKPILSEKDTKLPYFRDFQSPF
jgi:dTDP-4-dehydrorhamnose 3,5-epimerase